MKRKDAVTALYNLMRTKESFLNPEHMRISEDNADVLLRFMEAIGMIAPLKEGLCQCVRLSMCAYCNPDGHFIDNEWE